jgi:hypothetical protein
MAKKNDIDALITEKIALMDNAEFVDLVSELEKTLSVYVQNWYREKYGETKNMTVSERLTYMATQVNALEKKLVDLINKSKPFTEGIGQYMRKFEQIGKLNVRLHKKMSNIDVDDLVKLATKQQTELVGDIAGTVVGRIKKNLTDPLREIFIKPVKKMIYSNILAGTPATEMVGILQEFIEGDKDTFGKIARWGDQITRDSIREYDGAINNMIKDEYGLNAFRYIGSLVRDSRPLCVHIITTYDGDMTYEQLEEVLDKYSDSPGVMPGTTVENFTQHAGGYNCRHDVLPYYRPDAKET